MRRSSAFEKLLRLSFLFALIASFALILPEQAVAQQRSKARVSRRGRSEQRRAPSRSAQRGVRQRQRVQTVSTRMVKPAASTTTTLTPATTAPLPATAPLPPNVNPFAEIESEAANGQIITINFARTNLDTKAEATADVAVRGRTLLVRMRAKNMPLPEHFDVPRYALWVYVPNYKVKMYIGDLPITPTSRSRGNSSAARRSNSRGRQPVIRGESDSAYRFTVLPPDAVFGGLALTAEPVRYTPIINEALRPVLVSLMPKQDASSLVAATTLYSGPLPTDRQQSNGRLNHRR